MRQDETPEQGNGMERTRRTRHALGAIGRAFSTPVNAFRTKMPSGAAMGLTPSAQCRWADDGAAELGSRLRRACGEATLWCAEFDRMNAGGATPVAQFLAKGRSSARDEWERYRAWLVSAHGRLATGAPAGPVAADWIARRDRLSTIKPRQV